MGQYFLTKGTNIIGKEGVANLKNCAEKKSLFYINELHSTKFILICYANYRGVIHSIYRAKPPPLFFQFSVMPRNSEQNLRFCKTVIN